MGSRHVFAHTPYTPRYSLEKLKMNSVKMVLLLAIGYGKIHASPLQTNYRPQRNIRLEHNHSTRKLAVLQDVFTVVSLNDVSTNEPSAWFTLCHTQDDMIPNMTYNLCKGPGGPMLYFNLETKTPKFKNQIHASQDVPLLLHVKEVNGQRGTATLQSLTRGRLVVKFNKFDLKTSDDPDDFLLEFKYQ